MYPIARTTLHFFPYYTSPAPFNPRLHRLSSRIAQTLDDISCLSLAFAHPLLRVRSLILSPYYRMLVLVLVLVLALALAHPFLPALLLHIEFCSWSFMHPIRPIVRLLTHPPLHRHRYPFLPDIQSSFFLPSLYPSFRLLMRHRCRTMHSFTGYFSYLRHLIATRRLRNEHTYSL